MNRWALLVVDMIYDFVDGNERFPQTPNKQLVLKNCRTLIEFARHKSIPVIYVNDHFTEAEKPVALEFKLCGPHAIEGTRGAEVPTEIAPLKTDYIIHKKRYSGFTGTPLMLLLNELGTTNVLVVGIKTDVCVQHTVMDAFFLGYQTFVVHECCDTSSQEEHQRALAYMTRYYGTKVSSLQSISEFISAP